MKRVGFSLLMLALSVGLLSGCAFTNENVKLDFSPSGYSSVSTGGTTIHLDKLKDARGVAPNLVSYKGVQGKTGGQYLNDVEISEFLTDSIRQLLVQVGYNVDSSQSDFTLTGEILTFDSHCIMGFWSGSFEATIQVNLRLVKNKDNSMVWSETLSGHGKKGGAQVDRWGNRKLAFDLALNDLMQNIASSETFKAALNR